MKPSGVYIRYGRNKSQATPEEISRMYSESHEIAYESLKAREQDLTFKTLQRKFEEKDIDFNTFKMNTSGFINTKFDFYTNLAYWFSDQYNIDTKMAVYQGLTRSVFRSKKEYEGSIINQIDKVMEYFELCNEVRVIIDGSPMRTEIPSYNMHAAREAILNCYCHRDYSRKSNIKIEFFDDRCEIISPGGFYGGLTLEDALNGIQSFRNENLVKLLFKLGYIENYASGLTRVFEAYENISEKPIIDNSLVALKVTFPNINYDSFKREKYKIGFDIGGNIGYEKVDGSINDSINGSINGILSKYEKSIVHIIKENPNVTRKEICKILSLSIRTVDRNMESLKNKKVIERVGSNKSGKWVVK